MDSILELDGQLLLMIQEHARVDFLTPLVTGITHLCDSGIFWIILTLLLMIPKKTRKAALISALAMIISYIVNNLILKYGFSRTRPYEVIEGLTILVGKQKDFSFPSGHAATSFASSVALASQLPRKYGVPLVILAALIALSRLYVGVHYPTDVLVGTISGILCALLAIWLAKRIVRRRAA